MFTDRLCSLLAQSQTLQQVLDTVAEWINRIFESDRTSITLYENSDYLKVYSFPATKRFLPIFSCRLIKPSSGVCSKPTTDHL